MLAKNPAPWKRSRNLKHCRMCSDIGIVLILLIVCFNNINCVLITTTSTNNNNTTTIKNLTTTVRLGGHHHHHLYQHEVNKNILNVNNDDVGDFENISWHASTTIHQPQAATDESSTAATGDGAAAGHFIDITRKHKIHYNGQVIDEDNLLEHLREHERELIFGKSRKKRSIKLVHLTYRPNAATVHPTDVTTRYNKEGESVELQIPNNSLETVTAAVVHRSKRSDNEPASATATETPQQTPNSQGSSGGAPELPPIVSVQIKDNDHLVNLKLQQTPKLIDDAFVFIRRYANTSQLVENSHKLAERLEKCFYHNENSALDLCDGENVRGLYHHNQTDYIIHPLPERFGNNTHIILESESEIYDTMWSNTSSVLNENIQFEPEMEEFNDLNIETMADMENTTRETRNIDSGYHHGPDHARKLHHNHHAIPLNLRFKPRHHQHSHANTHSHQHHQHPHSHHSNAQNHHSQKTHHRKNNKQHHRNNNNHHQSDSSKLLDMDSEKFTKRARRFISPAKDWRSSSDVLHIETAIFVDTDLYKHMAKNFPKDTSSHLIRFVLAMINGVQLLYHHPSLGRRVNFVLKRLEILEKDPLDLPRSSDIDIYLSNFCKWQTRWNSAKDQKLHYDHAVILTGLDLYVVDKKGKLINQVVGLAPVAGMCIETSSCTINEGKHFESVFVVAHEIGHNLGMRHDSIDNGCEPTSHIMSPTLGSGKITWSKCSRDSLNLFLEKPQAKCLFNRAEFNHNLDHSAEGILPGERFDANQQCMLKYGKESTRARTQSLSDICRDLHCQRDRYTWTSHPALEGTACGDNMWCRSGFCVVKRIELYTATKQTAGLTKANYDKSAFMDSPKTGNLLHEYQKPSSSWSEWSEPSACDSSCLYGPSKRLREGSTGLKVYTRKCIDYKRRCIGRDHKFEACVAKQCYSVPMLTVADFAKQVCEKAQKFDSDLTGEGEQISGNIEESCKVYCKTKTNGTKSRSWTFPDGTTCLSKLYRHDEPSYCIQGRCEKFSCDNSTSNYYKIDNIFCKQQDKSNDMDNETIRRSSSSIPSSPSSSVTYQTYSNQIPIGPPPVAATHGPATASYNNYDEYKYRSNANKNYYERGSNPDRIYGPTTVRSKYENEVAVKPFHGQYNHDTTTYRRKSDNYAPWNKYGYHLNDHLPSESSQQKSPTSIAVVTSGPLETNENVWVVKSGCYSSCMERSKGIQVVMNRKTGEKNIQLCTHTVKPCERLQTTGEFADNTCSGYKTKVRGLSGHGIQIAASVEDPDRGCRVGCQDEFIQHRFYLVNGNYGHFPLGTRCSNSGDRYCVQGKCLEFGADHIPLQKSHISLALFRSRRSAKKHQQHSRKKRSFLYYDPVNITETLTQDFIDNIVNSIINQEENQVNEDNLLGHHIEFTNPIHYSMDEQQRQEHEH
ncbi:ADAMTS metallopeptidase stall [Musca autumnalis]|uniref:ADAMTS metallopeptidase stall n=1 Tax=Musca autumnalis TaxID=221902 RepID=UPI003CEC140C